MTTRSANGVLAGPLRALWGVGVVSGLSDGQLIDRIGTGHGEAAELSFQLLVERHGPMVLRVCQRMLNDPNDAEDAFQATFLVLLAARTPDSESRVSRELAARCGGARRGTGQGRRVAATPDRAAGSSAGGRTERRRERLDLESLIQHELARLPEKYRAPIVLCYLEGLTHESAADQLGWPVGTVRGRLARARDLLRARLTRRGMTASAALACAESLTESARAAVPAALRAGDGPGRHARCLRPNRRGRRVCPTSQPGPKVSPAS